MKWEGTRSEGFLADVHGRDTYCDGALALGDDGRILALQLDYIGNIGAHPLSSAVLSNLLRMAGPPYHVPAMHVRVRGAFTNTAPTSVYRGAGRPQVTYIVERLMDLGAKAVGLDRVEIRRRNLIGPAALPYRTRLGLTYDSGAFADNLQMALQLIDWDNFEARRSDAEHRGKLAGIGVANYVESPGAAAYERTDVTVRPDGTVHVVIGTQASGQGHETSFAQVVAGTLGVADGGDHHRVRRLRPGGRAAQAHTPIGRCDWEERSWFVRARTILAQGRLRAAECLGHNAATITYAAGQFAAADPFGQPVRGRIRGASRRNS